MRLSLHYYLLCGALLALASKAAHGQLAGINYGLRGKMGVSLNTEYNHVRPDVNGQAVSLRTQRYNLEASFPLLLRVDTATANVRIRILEATLRSRWQEQQFGGLFMHGEGNAPSHFIGQAIGLSYVRSIKLPWLFTVAASVNWVGNELASTPMNVAMNGFLLYRVNGKLTLGAGVLLNSNAAKWSWLVVPYIDWRAGDRWFATVTSPDYLIFGRRFGKEKRLELAWATYLEFLGQAAIAPVEEQPRHFLQTFEVACGLDARYRLWGRTYANVFFGNNFFRQYRVLNGQQEETLSTQAYSGMQVRAGVSLVLEN